MPEPKVLLGAPGSGKTETCKAIRRWLNGQITSAQDVVLNFFDETPEFEGQILIIDGLDEVFPEETRTASVKILNQVKNLGYKNWLISCRSYEWRPPQNFDDWIKKAFGTEPKVANIGDLTDDEIAKFLGEGAKRLQQEAKDKGMDEFLRNPQTLKMLVQAVESSWPETRTELFLSACKVMAVEHNQEHQEKRKNRATPDQIIQTAGWICVQLLMSDERAISLDGTDTDNVYRPAHLESDVYPSQKIEDACRTKLFKPAERNNVELVNNVEPVHRTVAEFLAGRWLAKEFNKSPLNLSPARVMNYMTFGTGRVSPALRGLHAWATSLSRKNRPQNIHLNPYGCLRYGDLEKFSDKDTLELLDALKTLSKDDPFFRSKDWHERFGSDLGRPSIKEAFLAIISDDDVSSQLKCTLLEAIQESELADMIGNELNAIIMSEDATYSERCTAIDVLSSSSALTDWKALADRLFESGTAESLKISIDEIISNNLDCFSGENIADHIIAYESTTLNDDVTYIFRFKLDIQKVFSNEKIMAVARRIADKMIDQGFDEKLEKWLLTFLPYVLLDCKPTADDLWPLISPLMSQSSDSFWGSKWNKVASLWFASNENIRREIQARALGNADEDDPCWLTFMHLSEISSGLSPLESDVIYHLERLVGLRKKPVDWLEKWKNFVLFVQSQRNFEGQAMEVARAQTKVYPELKKILDDLSSPSRPVRDFEKEYQERRREIDKANRRNFQEWHAYFTEFRTSVEEGKNLGALFDAAKAYLGLYSNFHGVNCPRERLVKMVGIENLEAVLVGFEIAGKRNDIPSVRDCAELRAREKKQYYLEIILLVLCLEVYRSGKPLTSLPDKTLLCALSACEWGMGFPSNLPGELQPKLEEILFVDREMKLNFVKDTMEPGLEAGEKHVSGLYRVTTEGRFADIMPELAVKWLSHFEDASQSAVWEILNASARFDDRSTRAKIADLIEVRLKKNQWASEEHRCAWHAAAFVFNFDRSRSCIKSFANEARDHLWVFRKIISESIAERVIEIPLSVEQISFLIDSFAPQWPMTNYPSRTWSGSSHPWNASDLIFDLMKRLREHKSEEAIAKLKEFANSERMGEYKGNFRHALVEAQYELGHSKTTLEDVRNMLLSGKPVNVSDLQVLFLEELGVYQKKIKKGITATYKIYWEGERAHEEEYCRDRLFDGLNEVMQKYEISMGKEETMPEKKRVDLLFSCDNFCLPVEIKKQHSRDIWTAAEDQLGDYIRYYKADGRGVYLVIWFGEEVKLPTRSPNGDRPKNPEEMLAALKKNYSKLPDATKIAVLDVSKPERQAKKAKRQVKKSQCTAPAQ